MNYENYFCITYVHVTEINTNWFLIYSLKHLWTRKSIKKLSVNNLNYFLIYTKNIYHTFTT